MMIAKASKEVGEKQKDETNTICLAAFNLSLP